MKSLIVALISLSSLTTFASRIPVCTITFTGTSAGGGIYKPMRQEIRGSLVIYDYHFENLRVDARFNLARGNKGMIMIVDKVSGRVLSMNRGALIDGEDETLETYFDLNEATYQIECMYQAEVPESDKADTKTPDPRAN